MRLTGIVLEQTGTRARVLVIPPECQEPNSWRPASAMECAGCHACDRRPCGDKERSVVEGDAGTHQFQTGDYVDAEVDGVGSWCAPLLYFGLPLTGLLGGMALGARFGWLVALFTLGGLAVGFALLKAVDRFAPRLLLGRTYRFTPQHDALSEDFRAVGETDGQGVEE